MCIVLDFWHLQSHHVTLHLDLGFLELWTGTSLLTGSGEQTKIPGRPGPAWRIFFPLLCFRSIIIVPKSGTW